MPLVTAAQAREHIETDLPDAALQRLIDDAESEIVRRFGPHAPGPVVEEHAGGDPLLFLRRPALSVQSVAEEVAYVVTALDASDYRLRFGGRAIERLPTGPHPRRFWGDLVTVTYAPVDDTPQRVRVLLDLVQLAVAYGAVDSVSVGDYSEQALDYQRERERLLAGLLPGGGLRF